MSIVEISSKHLSPIIKKWNFFSKPLIVGVSGPQGSGKSYLSENLAQKLRLQFPQLNIINISIDDFYLPHKDQLKLKDKYPNCSLVTDGRGLPGTYSIDMLLETFRKIQNRTTDFKIPGYDKSKFNGQGDRLPTSEWREIGNKPIDVVIFEGWFVGYRAIANEQQLRQVWDDAVSLHAENDEIRQMLASINYEQIRLINTLLGEYEPLWSNFDHFLYLATTDLLNVYRWRLEQEKNLIKLKGIGMTDELVKAFVNRFFPVYKLYYTRLLSDGLLAEKDTNLRLDIDLQRNILGTKLF